MNRLFEVSEDFPRIVDTLEQVTLYRSGCSDDPISIGAWRFEQEEESRDGPGSLNRLTATWQIPATEATRTLRPGDRLRDTINRCGVVTEVESLSGSTRIRCRVVTINYGGQAPERFDIVRILAGSETLLRPAVEGLWRTQREATEAATVYTLEETPVRVGDRLVRNLSEKHEVRRIVSPRSLGEPWEFEVARIIEGAP